MFQEVASRYDGPQIERTVLSFWEREGIFQKALAQREGRAEFVFYEGPPTANGRPGIHHVLARTFKDLFPRYKTMRGFHCDRKAGWDTHGLPVEHEVEKALGIYDKRRIEREVGIAKFAALCRESVTRYVADWEAMTQRMGFWVDLRHAYSTMENGYIQSVWHLLKQLWDHGLVYRGYKVVPYDPRIGATLSSHEVAQGYREVEDPSIYVRFPLLSEEGTSFLVWTTTPWTLPANLLLAVHPDVEYVWARRRGETLIVARELLGALGADSYEIIHSAPGRELDGLRYKELFDYLPADGDVYRVRAADFVTTADGTGIVHVAPAYGEDDLRLGQQWGLPVLHAVGEDGCFLDSVTPVAGRFFKDGDPVLIEVLRTRGLLFREERYRHSYPFGWRTGDPLIYYAKSAWYVRTTAFRDRMVEFNRRINWVPENIRDGRFGDWLEHNVDWALSRERFWGTPLPVWTDGEGDFVCVGSLSALEALTGRELAGIDLHRPAIDEVTFLKEGRLFRRVPEVIDCWFDSGAMPYAQYHCPGGSGDFERHFPADFICEAIDQTRGWFYTLHAIATMISDSVAYRNVVCLSHIVDEAGKKMSKSLGNILDPYSIFDTIGADALRWYFAARISPEIQKRVSIPIVADVAKGFINTYWNVYAFFVLYVRLDRVDLDRQLEDAALQVADRWVLSLLEDTVRTVTEALDQYDSLRAGGAIERFVDQLSNWYVRLNRRRFWKSAAGNDKQSAYLTLYECLEVTTRLMAPFMPFLSEAVYQNLVRNRPSEAPLSVHMADWPEHRPARVDHKLMAEIQVVQRIVTLGRAARNKSNIKIRQPLKVLFARASDRESSDAIRQHSEQIREELNVKSVQVLPQDANLITYVVKPNLPVVGKRYGKYVPAIRNALAHMDGTEIARKVARGEKVTASAAGRIFEFEPGDLLIETTAAEGLVCAEEGGYLVGFETALTDELVREGLAREIVRTVQDARKQAGLNVADRISLQVEGNAAAVAALTAHRDYVATETLVSRWGMPPDVAPDVSISHRVDHAEWTIALARSAQPD
jgi:isoleucyl-tRNA synthetase